MQNTESVALCILSKPCLLEVAIVLVTLEPSVMKDYSRAQVLDHIPYTLIRLLKQLSKCLNYKASVFQKWM